MFIAKKIFEKFWKFLNFPKILKNLVKNSLKSVLDDSKVAMLGINSKLMLRGLLQSHYFVAISQKNFKISKISQNLALKSP